MLRALGRGLRDTLDNLLTVAIASLLWWLGLLLIVTAPAATMALLTVADPRRLEEYKRPEKAELKAVLRRDLLPAWGLTLLFGIPALVLVQNLMHWGSSDSAFRLLTGLWVVLLLLIMAAAGIAGSLHAVHGLSFAAAARGAVVLTFSRAPQLLVVMVVVWIIIAICGVTVVPAVMILPGLLALIANHVTYALLGIPVVDPLDPTSERAAEQERARSSKYSVN